MIAKIPFEAIERVSIYINSGKKKLSEIKKETGADYLINAGLYNMKFFTPINMLTVGGKVLSRGGNPYGYGFNGSNITFSYDNGVKYPDFIGSYPLLIANGKQAFDSIPAGLGGDRGRSAIGLTSDSLVMCCIGDGRNDASLYDLCKIMMEAGCVNAINLDGGGSSQCDFNGQRIVSARIVHNYICVWMKKESPKEDDGLKTYTNGNTRKTVYETTACTKQIGSLDPGEVCWMLYEESKYKVVMYTITGTSERKVGFIKV